MRKRPSGDGAGRRRQAPSGRCLLSAGPSPHLQAHIFWGLAPATSRSTVLPWETVDRTPSWSHLPSAQGLVEGRHSMKRRDGSPLGLWRAELLLSCAMAPDALLNTVAQSRGRAVGRGTASTELRQQHLAAEQVKRTTLPRLGGTATRLCCHRLPVEHVVVC